MARNFSPIAEEETKKSYYYPRQGFIESYEVIPIAEERVESDLGKEKLKLSVTDAAGNTKIVKLSMGNFSSTWGWKEKQFEQEGKIITIWETPKFGEYVGLKQAAQRAGVMLIENIEVRDSKDVEGTEPHIEIFGVEVDPGQTDIVGMFIDIGVRTYTKKNGEQGESYEVKYLGKEAKWDTKKQPQKTLDQTPAQQPTKKEPAPTTAPAEQPKQDRREARRQRGIKEEQKPAIPTPVSEDNTAKEMLSYIAFMLKENNMNAEEPIGAKMLKFGLSEYNWSPASKALFIDAKPAEILDNLNDTINGLIESRDLVAGEGGRLSINKKEA
jgi:hypothetical protein